MKNKPKDYETININFDGNMLFVIIPKALDQAEIAPFLQSLPNAIRHNYAMMQFYSSHGRYPESLGEYADALADSLDNS